MPLYEYRCDACGQTVDIQHGFKETVSDACAACGGALTRVFNPAGTGIVFKGSGFYVTDSRAKSGEGAAKESSEGKPAESTADKAKSGESQSSESKPSESKSPETKPTGKGDAAA